MILIAVISRRWNLLVVISVLLFLIYVTSCCDICWFVFTSLFVFSSNLSNFTESSSIYLFICTFNLYNFCLRCLLVITSLLICRPSAWCRPWAFQSPFWAWVPLQGFEWLWMVIDVFIIDCLWLWICFPLLLLLLLIVFYFLGKIYNLSSVFVEVIFVCHVIDSFIYLFIVSL